MSTAIYVVGIMISESFGADLPDGTAQLVIYFVAYDLLMLIARFFK